MKAETGGQAPVPVKIALEHGRKLILRVFDGGNGTSYCHSSIRFADELVDLGDDLVAGVFEDIVAGVGVMVQLGLG